LWFIDDVPPLRIYVLSFSRLQASPTIWIVLGLFCGLNMLINSFAKLSTKPNASQPVVGAAFSREKMVNVGPFAAESRSYS
jgi:hypothetical protein